jgi:TonB-linked SusC/RagA family outer membrane protein
MYLTALDQIKTGRGALRPWLKAIARIGALLLALHISAGAFCQNVSFSGKDVPLKKVFASIKKQVGFVFFYDSELDPFLKKVTVDLQNVDVRVLIASCLDQQAVRLEYTIRDKTVFISRRQPGDIIRDSSDHLSKSAFTPIVETKITGKVLGPDGTGMVHASIRIKGMDRGVTTDKDGGFTMYVEEGQVLLFSYVGFETREIRMTKENLQKDFTVRMSRRDAYLDQVVMTGYQHIEQRYLTGAVTTLKMDSIAVPGINTIDKLMEGRVPGMTFMQNSGQVGATPQIRIRGSSTILGSQEPLWVLDGVPLSDPIKVDPSRLNDLDFVNLLGNAISGLNPADVEQIDVLKDASTTALYGARAANGVISITTKKGRPGPPTVSYSVTGTYSRRPRYTDRAVYMMNSKDRVDVSREMFEKGMVYDNVTNFVGYEAATIAYNNGSIDFSQYQKEVAYYETLNTDWLGLVGQDAFSQNHTLSLSGGGSNIRYYTSLGYTDDEGTIKNEASRRYSTNMNLTASYKRFTMEFGIQAYVTDQKHNPTDIGVLNYAYNMSRAIPAYNPDGSMYYFPRVSSYTGLAIPFNIVNEMNNSGDLLKTSAANMTTRLDYKLTRDLHLSATLNYNTSASGERTFYTDSSYYIRDLTRGGYAYSTLAPAGGELTTNDVTSNSYDIRFTGEYAKHFGTAGQHYVDFLVGGEASSDKYYGYNIKREGYQPDRGEVFLAINPANYRAYAQWLTGYTDPLALGVITDNLTNLASGFATLSYGYRDKYIFNVNARADGSNQFGTATNDKILPIWSSSARWDVKQDLLRHVSWVNGLAFKASFGYQGNMLDDQSPNLIIQKGNLNSIFNEYASTIQYYPNPNLKWEKTASTNLEADFSLFKNKLTGSFTYFYKRTANVFLDKTVSPINGVSQYVVNQGDIGNHGVEITLSVTAINNLRTDVRGKRKGFIWRFDPELGEVINQLLNRATTTNNPALQNTITYSDLLNGSVVFAHKPLNTFYSYKFEGLNHADGTPYFYGAEDANQTALAAKYAGMSNEDVYFAVMTESGTRVPLVQGGISNYLGYGNFGLSFNFAYSLGNKVRLLKLAGGYGTTTPYPQQNLREEMVRRWRKPGDERYTNIPGLKPNNDANSPWWQNTSYAFATNIYDMYDQSDLRVVSGDYLKLQSLALNYNFEQGFCRRLGAKAGYISLAGSNLFIFANKNLRGQDPSQSGSSPTINLAIYPTYSCNINLSF